MIVRVRRRAERPFVVLETATLRMKALSFKARGLWAMCMSYPDHWEIRLSHLVSMSARDGGAAVRSALEELKAVGLLTYEQERREDGTMGAGQWTIYETPRLNPFEPDGENRDPVKSATLPDGENRDPVNLPNSPDADKPDADKPDADKPDADKPDADNRRRGINEKAGSNDLSKQGRQARARVCARGAEGVESGQLSADSSKTAALRAESGQPSADSSKAALPAAAFSIEEERAGDAAAALASEDLPSGDALPARMLPADMLPAAAAFSKEEDQGKAHLVEQLVERGLDKAVARRLVDEGEAEQVRAMLARGAREAAGPGWYVRAIEQGYRAGARDGPGGRQRYTRAEALALLERRGVVLSQLNPLHRYFDVVREDGRAYFVERE